MKTTMMMKRHVEQAMYVCSLAFTAAVLIFSAVEKLHKKPAVKP